MQKENKENETSLEDWIETERHKLSEKHATLTKVTIETFVAWKKRKIQERKDEKKKMEEKKLRDFKAGNKIGVSKLSLNSHVKEGQRNNANNYSSIAQWKGYVYV